MDKNVKKQLGRVRRKHRVRAKVYGTSSVPRLSVFRSNKYIFAQLINDDKGETMTSVMSKKINEKGNKTEIAKIVGEQIAKLASAKEVKNIVFDRNGYKYHGRVKAVAEGARAGGLNF